MKDLTYIDKRHDNVITVKNSKSRQDAQRIVMEEYAPEWFASSTIEEMEDFEDYFYEPDVVITLSS